jgi:hypothetical protein
LHDEAELLSQRAHDRHSFDGRSGAGSSNDDPVERHLVIDRLHGAEGAVGADHTGFDPFAAFQLDDAGDDAAVQEVDLIDALMGGGEYIAMTQLRNGKVRPEAIDIRDAKTRQKAVFEWGMSCPPCPAGGSTTGLSATDAHGQSLGR